MRPEDVAAEKIYEQIYDLLEGCGIHLEDDIAEKLADAIYEFGIAMNDQGFRDGVAEVRMWNKVTPFEDPES